MCSYLLFSSSTHAEIEVMLRYLALDGLTYPDRAACTPEKALCVVLYRLSVKIKHIHRPKVVIRDLEFVVIVSDQLR